MKKWLAAVLVLVMALGMAGGAVALAEAEEELNLLWEIPFGASPKEVVYKAREVAGVSLVKQNSGDWYKSDEAQQIAIMGVPVESISVFFTDKVLNDDGTETKVLPSVYSSAQINFVKHQVNTDLEGLDDALAELVSVYNILLDRYGVPSYGYFMTFDAGKQDKHVYYEIQLSDIEGFNLRTPFRFLPDGHVLHIGFVFKNIRMIGVFSLNSTQCWSFISFEDGLLERPTFTPYQIGEEDEFDLDKLPKLESSVDAGF